MLIRVLVVVSVDVISMVLMSRVYAFSGSVLAYCSVCVRSDSLSLYLCLCVRICLSPSLFI